MLCVLSRAVAEVFYNEAYGFRKTQYAAMAQQVEHVLGKDEVTGSNPVSSSMIADEKAARQKPMENKTFFMGFFYFKRRK